MKKLKYLSAGLLSLFLSLPASAAMVSVCERTAPVRDFLVQTLKSPCENITEADLSNVTRVAVNRKNITAFKVGDFSGLPALEILNIMGNPYTELPEGLFAGLPKLKTIVIFDTQLKHLPDDFLEGLPALENLHLFSNPFRTVSESVFVRLAALKTLKVFDFNDSLLPAEKARARQIFPAGGPVELNFF